MLVRVIAISILSMPWVPPGSPAPKHDVNGIWKIEASTIEGSCFISGDKFESFWNVMVSTNGAVHVYLHDDPSFSSVEGTVVGDLGEFRGVNENKKTAVFIKMKLDSLTQMSGTRLFLKTEESGIPCYQSYKLSARKVISSDEISDEMKERMMLDGAI